MSDYGYEYYDDDERATELADLRDRIAALSDPSSGPGATEPVAVATTPPPADDDAEWVELVNNAGSAQEVEALLAQRAEMGEPVNATPLADAWDDVRNASQAGAWNRPPATAAPPQPGTPEGLDACRNADEVMAYLRSSGVPVKDEVSW